VSQLRRKPEAPLAKAGIPGAPGRYGKSDEKAKSFSFFLW